MDAPPDLFAHVARRFGAEAVRALAAVAGDPVDARVRESGPLAWLEVATGPFTRHSSLCFVDTAWVALAGGDAFAHVLAEARPDLADWAPIVRAYGDLTGAEPLPTRADVEDLADPRWHVIVLDADGLRQWEPPHVAHGALTFVAHDHGALVAVRVSEGYAVTVTRRT